MKERISYSADGSRRYFVGDNEVTEEQYKLRTQARDELRLLDMLKSGRPPTGVSDCTFMKDTANGRQFNDCQHMGNYYKHITEREGGNTNGKKYLSGLARYPGDPEAWVDSRGDVERILTKRGWGCEGSINIKPRESLTPPAPGPEVADDLLDKYTAQIASAQPSPHLVDTDDLREQVKERLKPKRKREVSKANVA